jgi:hypothetical protein
VCVYIYIHIKVVIYVSVYVLLHQAVNSRTKIHIHATKGRLTSAPYHTTMQEQYFLASIISYKTHVIWKLKYLKSAFREQNRENRGSVSQEAQNYTLKKLRYSRRTVHKRPRSSSEWCMWERKSGCLQNIWGQLFCQISGDITEQHVDKHFYV